MPTLTLILEDSYWSKGFFNIPRDFERFVTHDDGAIEIYLGDSPIALIGRVSRSANNNATPRIYGNKQLVAYFRDTCTRGGRIQIQIVSPTALRLRPLRSVQEQGV